MPRASQLRYSTCTDCWQRRLLLEFPAELHPTDRRHPSFLTHNLSAEQYFALCCCVRPQAIPHGAPVHEGSFRSGDALAPAGTTALVSLAAIGSFALQTWIKSPLIFGGANSGASPGRRGLASAPKSPVMQGMSSPKPRVDFSAELQQYLSNDVLTTYVRYFGGF